MSTSETRIPLSIAKNVALRFMHFIEPACSLISVAGSVRRESDTVGDVEICVVAKDEFSLGKLFPEGFKGMVVNGARLKRFKYPESGIQIELYITSIQDWGRILAIRTGSSAFSHHLAVQWNRRGFAGTSDGLRLKSECDHKGSTWKIKPEYKHAPTLPPVFDTEEKFFNFIGVEYIEPQKRSWVSNNKEYNYNI